MKIYNLDKYRNDFVKIQLGGKVYEIPEKAPMSVTLSVYEYREALKEGDMEKIELTVKAIHNVFLIKQPDFKYEEFKSLIDFNILLMITNLMQGVKPEETEEALNSVNLDEEKKTQSQDSGSE